MNSGSARSQPSLGRFLRPAFYLAYAAFGIVHALSWRYPLLSWEIQFSHQKMADAWGDFSWNVLSQIPYRSVESGAIPLFFWAAPFFWLLGPCQAALRLAVVAWNAVGLALIDRSLPDRSEGVLAAALASLSLPYVSFTQLVPNGGYNQGLLPLGLLLFLASRFLKGEGNLSRFDASLYGFAAGAITVFMLPLGILTAVVCLVCLMSLPAPVAKHLLPSLLLGILAGVVLGAPLLLRQMEPGSSALWSYVIQELRHYPGRLAWLLAQDLAAYAVLQPIPFSGYLFEVVLLCVIVWGFRSGSFKKDRLLQIVLVGSIALPLWIILYPSYIPERQMADVFRLRYLGMCWPIWSVLVAMGSVRLWRSSAGTRCRAVLRRSPIVLSAVWLAGGVAWNFGSIDYCHLGVTRRMPLSTPVGRILTTADLRYLFPGTLEELLRAPAGIRKTQAMFFPHWFMIMGYENQTLPWFRQLPADLREPYAFGAGWMSCEGSIPVLPEARAALESLQGEMSASERDALTRGCRMAKKWSAGKIEIPYAVWPLEEQTVELSSCQLFRDWEYVGSLSLDKKRLEWPLTGGLF